MRVSGSAIMALRRSFGEENKLFNYFKRVQTIIAKDLVDSSEQEKL